MIKKIPLFYFRPTICFVDDNKLFLDAVKQMFDEEYHCLTFVNSEEALQFLTSYQSPCAKINFIRELAESDNFDINDNLPININIAEITQLANLSSIKSEIAILIIDNNMPSLNGIEICQKLREIAPYKKILLTGQTELTEIIDAFNNGIIDKFIAKDQDISAKLQKSIYDLSYQYFCEMTKNLLNHLEASRPSPLSDPKFIDLFYHFVEVNSYKEFYLINKLGSFLFKDRDGSTIYLVVMSESAINELIKLNDDAVDKVGDLLLQLSRGESIPFFGLGKESWDFSYEDWGKHFYPANVIQGREKYYWAIVRSGEIA